MLKIRPMLSPFLAALGPGQRARRYPLITISVFCWEIITIAVIAVVVEITIVAGFREKQPWPSVSSGGILDDAGDLSPQLSLALPQENSCI